MPNAEAVVVVALAASLLLLLALSGVALAAARSRRRVSRAATAAVVVATVLWGAWCVTLLVPRGADGDSSRLAALLERAVAAFAFLAPLAAAAAWWARRVWVRCRPR